MICKARYCLWLAFLAAGVLGRPNPAFSSVTVDGQVITGTDQDDNSEPASGDEDLQTSNQKTSPSFNCTKAKSAVEKKICESPELSVADKNMGDFYHELLRRLPVSQANQLRQSQRAWLKQRDSCASPVVNSGCVDAQYMDRMSEFEKISGQSTKVGGKESKNGQGIWHERQNNLNGFRYREPEDMSPMIEAKTLLKSQLQFYDNLSGLSFRYRPEDNTWRLSDDSPVCIKPRYQNPNRLPFYWGTGSRHADGCADRAVFLTDKYYAIVVDVNCGVKDLDLLKKVVGSVIPQEDISIIKARCKESWRKVDTPE